MTTLLLCKHWRLCPKRNQKCSQFLCIFEKSIELKFCHQGEVPSLKEGFHWASWFFFIFSQFAIQMNFNDTGSMQAHGCCLEHHRNSRYPTPNTDMFKILQLVCVCVFYKPNYWNWVILIWCCFLKLVVHRLSEVFAIDNQSAVKVILQWRTCLGPWGTKREETSMSQDPWRETTIVRGIYKEISLEGSQ